MEEGRRSVDAVVIAPLLGGLPSMGFLPFPTDDGALPIVLTVLVVVAIATVAVMMGVVGVLFPVVGLIGAIRLAKPASFWAKRRSEPGGRKLAGATKRYERHTRRYQRFEDRVAGAPEVPPG